MSPLFVIAILISMSPVFPVEDKENILFIGDLIHRDSPMSPFYNHSATPSELSRNSLRHSINRANHLSSMFFDGKWYSSDLNTYLLASMYFMPLRVGSKKYKFTVAIDLTCNLLWVTFSQEGYGQIYSETHKFVPESSRFCDYAGKVPGVGGEPSHICEFSYTLLDTSGWVKGFLGEDSIYLKQGLEDEDIEELYELKSVVYGESFPGQHGRKWYSSKIEGVIGLGRGLLSFVRQKEVDIEYKFSYCLANDNGKIIFGTDPSRYDTETITTLTVDENHESLYQVSLRLITVQGKSTSYLQDAEYMILDPGTKHTFLQQDFYDEFHRILKHAIPYQDSDVSTIPENIGPCYPWHTTEKHIKSLKIIFSFDGGEISLPYESTFERFGPFTCCTILPHDKLFIFGSMAQVNFKVEYNLRKNSVSFTPTDCTTFPRLDQ